jgi:uncharacterized delta-60 repeat protein
MKSPLAQAIHALLREMGPTAAVATGLMSASALGAPGDLDPAFGDVGRVSSALDFAGPAWSLLPLDGGGSVFAGGEHCDGFYCYYYDDGFVGTLSGAGSLDSHVTAALLAQTQVLDITRQPDGKVIAVGRTSSNQHTPSYSVSLTVFRLDPGGDLDPTFGDGGIVHVTGSPDSVAQSVTLDPNGGIVVAGSRDGKLLALRLLADGSLDTTFGASGFFTGPPNDFWAERMHLLRTASGGYRVNTNFYDAQNIARCRVVALTANGAFDTTFGSSGIAALDPPSGDPVSCSSMAAQPDGRLVLAGRENGHGFAMRLLASGNPDPGFTAGAVASAMQDAGALAIDGNGSILVAGLPPVGVPGAVIVRLEADGTLDGLFGNAGSTWIDLPSDTGSTPLVHDMSVLSDGRILAAGGDGARPFVVRLLGDTGAGPGALSVVQPGISVKEQNQEALVTVRRAGGASGAVSVRYETAPLRDYHGPAATAGQDFTPVVGRLSWPDGDTTDRQISVPIANDTSPEEHELFAVTLDDVQGGAGLGTRNATVTILGDGDPAGQFGISSSTGLAISSPNVLVVESAGHAEVQVSRNLYATGAVSVTLTPVAGTATPDDFSTTPVTVSWSDGESGAKTVRIGITNDSSIEPTETFSVELSNPTGGAIVGPHATATISIVNDDGPPVSSGGGGGGAFGFPSLLLLGAARFLRSALTQLAMRQRALGDSGAGGHYRR